MSVSEAFTAWRTEAKTLHALNRSIEALRLDLNALERELERQTTATGNAYYNLNQAVADETP